MTLVVFLIYNASEIACACMFTLCVSFDWDLYAIRNQKNVFLVTIIYIHFLMDFFIFGFIP